MNQVVLFGAGERLYEFLRYRKYNEQIFQDKIIAIFDNDTNKQGKRIENFEILSPEQLGDFTWKSIIVTANYYNEIKKQLKDVFGYEECVVHIDEYLRENMIQYQYERNLKENKDKVLQDEDRFNLKSLVVYTAIMGDYDELKDPLFVSDDIKYVCFTDDKKLKSNVWEMRYVEKSENSKLQVREYKILPHKFFPEYETSIWVDASFDIRGDLREFASQYQNKSNMLFFPHIERKCIYEEAAECMTRHLDENSKLLEQINKYMNSGYPINQGLVFCGCIVRNHKKKNVIKLMEDWWKEVQNYSQRDQVSLPYLIWKNKVSYDVCNQYNEWNPWLKQNKHKRLK